MPWHIETDNPDCSGYAVVKDADGEVEGCHRTREQAERQLAALNIAEDEDEDDEGIDDDENLANERAEMSFTPNDAMVAESQRGLDWRAEFNRGGTEIGVARARDIANRRNLSLDTIGRMVSYFARHEIDKEGEGWDPADNGYPSAGRIAWALWGGNPGRTWAEAIRNETRAGQGPLAIITDIDGTLRLEAENNKQLIEYLNSSEADVIVITGRNESDRDTTEDYLDSIGLNYEILEMSTGGNPAAYKKRVASRLLQRYTIEEAYENDEAARNAYESLGINAKTPTPNFDRAREILAQHRQR